MINSFLTIDSLGCFNSSDIRIKTNADALSEAIRLKYFDLIEEYTLKRDRFIEALKSNQLDPTPTLNDEPDPEEYLDEDVLELTKFLSKHAVDLACLENVAADRIMKLTYNSRFLLYYDDDFFDRTATEDYLCYNRLNLNPNLRLLIGTLKVRSH